MILLLNSGGYIIASAWYMYTNYVIYVRANACIKVVCTFTVQETPYLWYHCSHPLSQKIASSSSLTSLPHPPHGQVSLLSLTAATPPSSAAERSVSFCEKIVGLNGKEAYSSTKIVRTYVRSVRHFEDWCYVIPLCGQQCGARSIVIGVCALFRKFTLSIPRCSRLEKLLKNGHF